MPELHLEGCARKRATTPRPRGPSILGRGPSNSRPSARQSLALSLSDCASFLKNITPNAWFLLFPLSVLLFPLSDVVWRQNRTCPQRLEPPSSPCFCYLGFLVQLPCGWVSSLWWDGHTTWAHLGRDLDYFAHGYVPRACTVTGTGQELNKRLSGERACSACFWVVSSRLITVFNDHLHKPPSAQDHAEHWHHSGLNFIGNNSRFIDNCKEIWRFHAFFIQPPPMLMFYIIIV